MSDVEPLKFECTRPFPESPAVKAPGEIDHAAWVEHAHHVMDWRYTTFEDWINASVRSVEQELLDQGLTPLQVVQTASRIKRAVILPWAEQLINYMADGCKCAASSFHVGQIGHEGEGEARRVEFFRQVFDIDVAPLEPRDHWCE